MAGLVIEVNGVNEDEGITRSRIVANLLIGEGRERKGREEPSLFMYKI